MIEKIKKLLDKFVDTCFYGSVVLQFRAGKLIGFELKRTVKPDEIQ